MKYVEVKKGLFEKLSFEVKVSIVPAGVVCCCGYTDCQDPDCIPKT